MRENRWFAGRYGLDASLIVEDHPGGTQRRPVRELVTELVDELMPIAEELGSEVELGHVLEILATGSGTERQRRLIESGGTLTDVVHHLVSELADDRPNA